MQYPESGKVSMEDLFRVGHISLLTRHLVNEIKFEWLCYTDGVCIIFCKMLSLSRQSYSALHEIFFLLQPLMCGALTTSLMFQTPSKHPTSRNLSFLSHHQICQLAISCRSRVPQDFRIRDFGRTIETDYAKIRAKYRELDSTEVGCSRC